MVKRGFDVSKEIKAEIENLAKQIEHHNNLYYNEDNPEISDYEYDILLRKLANLEKKYPQYRLEKSPVAHVGGIASSSFEKVFHKVQMGSLQDAFDFSELQQFDNRVREKIFDVSYIVEPKVDGLSVSLEYENGKFVRGSTRGNGFVGEDVTQNLKMISSIPQTIGKNIPLLEVRAEVFMPTKKFQDLILSQKNSNETPFKNPRNAAAGSLRQKDPLIVRSRGLEAIVFNVQRFEGFEILTHSDSIKMLKNLGFKTIPESDIFDNIEDCITEINNIGKRRNEYPFDIDGAVIKLNLLESRQKMGSTAKNPRWAIAFKYPPEQKQTTLKSIEINVGRTGTLTPVAIFDPIIIAGTTVSRASLHNQDFIDNKDIRIGDTILVRKAGEIIPEVIKSLKHQKNSVLYKLPPNCPICGSLAVRNQGEAATRCQNPSCPATITQNLIHFASRDAMNIIGLGEANVKILIKSGLIHDVSDIYTLTKDQVMTLSRFKEKSAQNLIDSIENSKNNPLWRLIFGLGIRGVGASVAKLLCKNYADIFGLIDAKPDDLAEIDGIGPVLAANIEKFFLLDQTKALIFRLSSLGLNMKSNSKSPNEDFLKGLTFAITGKLKAKTRGEIKQLIEDFGGKVSSSISSKTNYLIAGDNAGSKLSKALNLNVKILGEDEALEMLSNS